LVKGLERESYAEMTFTGMGEKDVALGRDDVSKCRDSDDAEELKVRLTRASLMSAPGFDLDN